MITRMAPGIEDTVAMLKSIKGLNRLTVFRHSRGGNNCVNTRSCIFPLESNKIIWGPKGERVPVIVTEICDNGTISCILIEITHDDDILVGMVDGIIGEVLKEWHRVFNGGIY